jgi:hypothetical protein
MIQQVRLLLKAVRNIMYLARIGNIGNTVASVILL